MNFVKKISFFFIVILCSELFAQSDSIRYEQLLKQADKLYNIDLDKSIEFLKKADSLAIIKEWKVLEGGAKRELAKNYLTKGNVEKSDEYINQAIEIFQANKSLNRLAHSYSLKSIIKGRLNQPQEAIRLLLKAIEIHKEIGNEEGLSTCYSNISIDYIKLKDYNEAEKYLIKSEKINLKHNNEYSLFYTYLNLGNVYILKNQLIKSEEVLFKALKISKKYNNVDGEVSCLNTIGNLYEKKKKRDVALKYYNEALMKAKRANLPMEESEVLEDLHTFYLQNGNYKNAYEAYHEYISLKDSLYNIDKINKISELEKQLELHEKEAIILEKNSEISKVNLEAEHQKKIKFIILGVVIVLIIAIAIVIRSLIGKQKANKVLELRQQIINEKNEELNQQNEEILAQRDQIEHQNRKLELKSQLVTESINTARRIQTAFFQSEEKEKKLLGNYFAFFKPKDIVSGDFYWSNINEENPNIIYISVADCTGHGVPGALMSMLGLSFINEILNESPNIYPSDLLEKLRAKVIIELGQKEANQTKEGMDMSVVRIDTLTNEVVFAGANNPMYIIRNSESKNVEIYKGTKQPIGISEITKPFTQSTHQLAKGDMIYLFSDGYPDQFGGPKGKKMGYKNFRDILLNISELPVDLQKIEVENQFEKWMNTEEQIDDVCVLGIRI